MIAFILGNWQRFVAYTLLAGVLLGAVFLFGYSRGEIQLYEYQAKEATKKVAVVVKIKEADNEALRNLRRDNANLRRLYDDASKANSLSSIAGSGACADARAGLPAVQGNGDQAAARPVLNANRVLDDVEGAVFAILAVGDAEIAKCRRLYQRDVDAAKASE